MIKIKLLTLLLILVTNVFLVGCNDKKSNPVNPTTKKDTSVFLGKWVEIFDTMDARPEIKAQKIKYWKSGTSSFSTPDTFRFSDSLWTNVNGFDFYYTYTKDSISFYSKLIGTNTKELENQYRYYLSNDTLIYNPDSLNYTPVSIRISK